MSFEKRNVLCCLMLSVGVLTATVIVGCGPMPTRTFDGRSMFGFAGESSKSHNIQQSQVAKADSNESIRASRQSPQLSRLEYAHKINQQTLNQASYTADPATPKDAASSAQAAYDARIAAQTGRPIRSSRKAYQQVALFGDLPTAGDKTQTPAGSIDGNHATQSIQQHTFATEGECFDPRISPDSRLLAFASTQHTLKSDIYIKPINATAITQLTSNPASDVQPAFSSDSQKIAFCSDRMGNWDVFVIDADGRNLQQVTNDPAPEMHPSFSPDGKKITYCRYNSQSGRWEIWLLDLEKAGQRKYITTGLFPNFSAHDTKIVYQRPNQRGSQLFSIWMIKLGSDDQPSMPTQIASSAKRALIGPQWSPDGERVVYCSVQPTKKGEAVVDAQIWIVKADGSDTKPVTDPGIGCFSPSWGSEGRIFFSSNRGECENVWSVTPGVTRGQIASAQKNLHLQNTNHEVAAIKPNHPLQLKNMPEIQVDSRSTAEVLEH